MGNRRAQVTGRAGNKKRWVTGTAIKGVQNLYWLFESRFTQDIKVNRSIIFLQYRNVCQSSFEQPGPEV